MDRTPLLLLTCILLAACGGQEVERTFHANGNIKHHLQKKNGKLHGIIKEYYASGKIKYRGEWFEGAANGLIEQFFENGQLRSRAFYTRGKQEGPDDAYFENGSPSFSANYKNGKMTGVSSVYYENGVISERTTYDSLGNVIHHALFSPQEDRIHSYMLPQVQVFKDTLWAGEQAMIGIRFPLPATGKIIINGSEQGPDEKVKAIALNQIAQCAATDTVLFIRRYYTPGSYLITLYFDHTHTLPGDTLMVQGVKKRYTLFVRGRSIAL